MTAPDAQPQEGSGPVRARERSDGRPPGALAGGLLIRPAIAVGSVLLLVLVGVGGWWVLDVQRAWARLDTAAEQFVAPPGFSELDRVRSGTAFCSGSCTAAVTIVMSVDDRVGDGACAALESSVDSVTDGSREWVPRHDDYECSWTGELGGGSTATGLVIHRSNMRTYGPAGGYPWYWTDERDIPPEWGPVLAWVEYTSQR